MAAGREELGWGVPQTRRSSKQEKLQVGKLHMSLHIDQQSMAIQKSALYVASYLVAPTATSCLGASVRSSPLRAACSRRG